MSFGLQTARALVVDNDFGEAQPVILALSRLRIGSVYLNGDVELVEGNDCFRGIRLALVDMDLVGDGGASPEELGVHAADYLAEALSPDNGMLAVLIWTKNEDAAGHFLAHLRVRLCGSVVLSIGTMTKPASVPVGESGPQGEAAEEIVDQVTEQLRAAAGMHLLWQWEQLTHDAVSASSENLIEVVRKESGVDLTNIASVATGLVNCFGLLASAARERRAANGREAATHAFLGMLPILEDGAEQSSDRLDQIEENALGALLIAVSDPKILRDRSLEARARFGRLNRMVHVSRWREEVTPLLPGNVYKLTKEFAGVLGLNVERLFSSLVGEAYKADVGNTEPMLVIAEVSPACDYAQNKVDVPRVLGGVLIPTEKLNKVQSHDYIYRSFGVFHFDAEEISGMSEGSYHFALNARFFTGVSIERLMERRSLFRIRRNTLVDIQAWLSRYGNRPGVITIAS